MAVKLKNAAERSKAGKTAGAGAGSNETLVQKTSHAVIQFIRDQRLAVGDTLPSEAEIATELKVSRTVVREAFGALAALKLIDVGSGRRARVGKIDHAAMALTFDHALQTNQMSLQQIWDVRRALELRTAELAANRRTDDEAKQLLFHAAAMRKALADRPTRMQHDAAIHCLIAKATRNPLFENIVSSFGVVMLGQITDIDQPDQDHIQQVILIHERLAQTIADRDAAGAAATMKEHFYRSLRAMAEAGVY
jgi:GntR family transcriptional repressor for pyruvate dehydrogenase complex